MTRDQFTKYSYRHSELMILHSKHPETDIDCMLVAVDFDKEVFQLWPLDQEAYEDKSYWVNYEHVDKPKRKPKMKIIK